jgi:hypothetical protein
MLNLNDPPELPPPGPHPHLRLVPKGPPVVFRLPEQPEVPWQVRAIAIFLGVTISVLVVTGIVFVGALVKNLYDQVDAAQRERESREQAAPVRPDAIPVVMPEQPPSPPPQTPPE